MKKFKFNFSFLDRFKKTKSEQSGEFEIDSDLDESPEDFAEKTLSEYKLNNHDELDNNSTDYSEESITSAEPPLAPKPANLFKFPNFSRKEKVDNNPKSKVSKQPANAFEKISWNDFILRLFSPYARGRVHAIFIIFLVVVVTYMLGKNIALFSNSNPTIVLKNRPTISLPPDRSDTILQDINKISSINLFNAKENEKAEAVTAKKNIDSIVCLDAEVKSGLEIKLLDTIVLQDSVKSVASVQLRNSSELLNVREGEHLGEMAEVSRITRMKIILKNLQTGECEFASAESEEETVMPEMTILSAKAGKSLFKSMNPNIKNTGNNFKIKRTFRDSMINNMSDILTQAKAVQITNPDGSLCFKMTEVVAGSLYSQLDIQESDIICNINGKKIENLNELMGLLGRIKEIDQFQIGLKRNGIPENKEYGFE